MDFPLLHLEQNLIVNLQREVWAFYRLLGWHYDYLGRSDRIAHLHRLVRLFTDLQGFDGQLLLVPQPHRLQAYLDDLAAGTAGPLAGAGRRYCAEAAARLRLALPNAAPEQACLVGLKLPLPQSAPAGGDWRSLWRLPKQWLEGLAGVADPSLTEQEIVAALEREALLFQRLTRILPADRLTAAGLAALIRRGFRRGISDDAPLTAPPVEILAELAGPGGLRLLPQWRRLRTLAEGEVDLRHPRRIAITQAGAAGDATGYTTFSVLSELPDELAFPGGEWLYHLQDLNFPVEVCLRWSHIGSGDALALVRKKKLEISDQDEHTRRSGEAVPFALLDAQDQAALLEYDLKQRRFPLLETTCSFAVWAETPDLLADRVQRLRDHLAVLQVGVEVPTGDQLVAFLDALPGTRRQPSDYTHRLPPEVVAGAMFPATRALGDHCGPYIGRVGVLNRPVFLDPALPPQINSSGSAAFLGTLGAGKSFAANLLTYLAVVTRGARALIIDPKGERGDWPRLLPELGDQIRLVQLTPDPADSGRLDPLALARGLGPDVQAEVASLAVSLLSFLSGVGTGDPGFLAIMEAVERVAGQRRPSLKAVLAELARLGEGDPVAATLARQLTALSRQAYANLLFGDGGAGLDTGAALTVLQLRHVPLPPPGKPREDFTLEELVAVAVLHAITAFATLFIRQDRSVFKLVVLDEAWSVLASSQGKGLVSHLLRTGRAMNSALYLITQNCADLLDETIRNNLGYKFVMRAQDQAEVAAVLQLLGLEATRENVSAVRSLQTGSALLQDLQGRVGVVRLDAVLPHLAAAFDTRPPRPVSVGVAL